jgi:hypothetical protein
MFGEGSTYVIDYHAMFHRYYSIAFVVVVVVVVGEG